MRRITIFRTIGTAITMPFLIILYLNIEKWAERHGYDLYLTNLIAAEGDVVSPFVTFALRPEMSYIALAVVTFVAGVWCDAALRRSEKKRTPKIETIKTLGNECLELAQTIDILLSNLEHADMQQIHTTLWSDFLPVSIKLEDLGLETPDHGITSTEEADSVRTYMRFVGRLLQNGQVKFAKKTAKSLTNDPNRTTEDSLSQSRLSTAIGRLRRILPG